MTIFILVSILLVTALAIALLMGVSPASQKVKVRTMYVGAALMLVVALVVCPDNVCRSCAYARSCSYRL